MAILRVREIRKMSNAELDKKLSDLYLQLAKERANISIGASVTSPGKIKEIKKTIARIKCIQTEMKNKPQVSSEPERTKKKKPKKQVKKSKSKNKENKAEERK